MTFISLLIMYLLGYASYSKINNRCKLPTGFMWRFVVDTFYNKGRYELYDVINNRIVAFIVCVTKQGAIVDSYTEWQTPFGSATNLDKAMCLVQKHLAKINWEIKS